MPTKKSGTAKFTDEEVRMLRREHNAAKFGLDVRQYAAVYGVAPETFRRMLRGETFAHVMDAAQPATDKGGRLAPWSAASGKEMPMTTEMDQMILDSQRRLKEIMTKDAAGDKLVEEIANKHNALGTKLENLQQSMRRRPVNPIEEE